MGWREWKGNWTVSWFVLWNWCLRHVIPRRGGARFWPCPSLSKLYKGSFKFDEKGWLFVCLFWGVGVWVWCDKGQRSAPVWGHLRTGSQTNQRLASDLLCNREWRWTQIILPPLPKCLDFCACNTTPSSCIIFENLVFSYKLGRGFVCVKFDFLFVCFLFSLSG